MFASLNYNFFIFKIVVFWTYTICVFTFQNSLPFTIFYQENKDDRLCLGDKGYSIPYDKLYPDAASIY